MIRVDTTVTGHRMVWLAEIPALTHGLRHHGLGELAAAIHAIACGADGNTCVRVKFVHSTHIVDELLAEIRGRKAVMV